MTRYVIADLFFAVVMDDGICNGNRIFTFVKSIPTNGSCENIYISVLYKLVNGNWATFYRNQTVNISEILHASQARCIYYIIRITRLIHFRDNREYY